jgi:hypothetical protein
MTTLDKPLHNVRKPSTLEIVTIAFEIPEYMAVGDGLTTCIRVFCTVSAWLQVFPGLALIVVAYLEEVDGVHDRVFLGRVSRWVRVAASTVAYSNAGERAR